MAAKEKLIDVDISELSLISSNYWPEGNQKGKLEDIEFDVGDTNRIW